MHTPHPEAISYTHTATPEQATHDQHTIDTYCHTHNINLTKRYHDIAATQTGIRALHTAITATLDAGVRSADYLFTTHWPPTHLNQPALDALEADLGAAGITIVALTTPTATSGHTAEEATND